MPKEYIDTCYICNTLQLTRRHYEVLMCNACYKLIRRMCRKYYADTGEQMTRDEFLTKATTRRTELKENGKWEKDYSKKLPSIRIVTSE